MGDLQEAINGKSHRHFLSLYPPPDFPSKLTARVVARLPSTEHRRCVGLLVYHWGVVEPSICPFKTINPLLWGLSHLHAITAIFRFYFWDLLFIFGVCF